MRLPKGFLLFLILGPAFWLGVFTPALAAQSRRVVDFINAATQPVYAIRIGPGAGAAWSGDLLGPMDVVDVGDGQRLTVVLQDTCWYDVRYEFGDGTADELHGVDLCSAKRVFLVTPRRNPDRKSAPRAARTVSKF